MSTITPSRSPPPFLFLPRFHFVSSQLFICCALGVVVLLLLLLVGGGPLLELTHVQVFRGVFKSCQIL